MNEEQQPTTTAPSGDTVEINDINTFARAVAHWYNQRVALIKHLLTIPEGTAFEIDDQSIVIEGITRAGFLFGVELAIIQLGNLPFTAEVEANQEQDPQQELPLAAGG